MQIAAAYAGAGTARWHANPALARSGQTVADHQGRCILLLVLLHPGPVPTALATYLALHDMGEARAGDLSAPFKRAFPEVAAAHAEAESELLADLLGMPLPYLTPRERDWVHLIDRLEAAAWCLLTAPAEFDRPSSGWAGAMVDILALAEELGVGVQVNRFVTDLRGGRW